MPDWAISAPWWVVAGLSVTVLFAVFKAARWTAQVDSRLSALERLMTRMQDDIRTMQDDIRTMQDDIRTMQGDIRTMQGDIRTMQGDIKVIFGRLPAPQAVQEFSPVQLTDFGREISATGSASDWARTNAPKLETDAAGKEEFEIFALCVEHVQRAYADDPGFQRTVNATAYQHGTETEQVFKVYQVELRDRLLKTLSPPQASTPEVEESD